METACRKAEVHNPSQLLEQEALGGRRELTPDDGMAEVELEVMDLERDLGDLNPQV